MKKNFTSIIMQCFDPNLAIRQMSMACVATIRKFTEGEYEIIVVDNEPKLPLRDDYGVLKIDKFIVNEIDKGCFASYNQGAKEAEGDVLVFIQNDVFVTEGWLPNMRHYIDNKIADAVFPDQMPRTRSFIKESYEMSFEEARKWGSRDAGLLMISREAFDKVGGWDERITASIIGWGLMFKQMSEKGISFTDTCKALVIHLMARTNFDKDPVKYNDELREESEIINA